MKRAILPHIQKLLQKKIVLLMGPRQVGKTTLAQSLNKSLAYYNYDIKKDISVFKNQEWDTSKELVVFDELHKMKKWKLWLKGIYDEGRSKKQNLLVTGSARLDVAKKMGDSLAGRFFSIRLNPLDLKELKGQNTAEENYKKLIQISGFPEPFFEGTVSFYNLWSKSHTDLILKQDLISLENIRDLDGIENLVALLSERVSSVVSYSSLARDLDRSDKTIKHWLNLLEQMFIIFKVTPYSKNVTRSLKLASKYYFYDCAKVQGDESQKFENLVALSLKKEIEFLEDCLGLPGKLHFVQNKSKKELDFLIVQNSKPHYLIEAKLNDSSVSKNFSLFSNYFPNAKKIQLVRSLERNYKSKDDVFVENALQFLENLDFSQNNLK